MTSNNGKPTITKEMIAKKAKSDYRVVPIPGWGNLGIRSCPELTRSRRFAAMFDANDNRVLEQRGRQRIYTLIDQLMIDEKTPLYSEADFDELAKLDGAKLDPLVAAVRKFNEESEKNELAGSNDASNTSDATTV